MSRDAEYLKYIGKLMAGKGNVRPSGRKSFYRRRSKKEITAIVKKANILAYGKQTEFLKELGATRSNLLYWRKCVAEWEQDIT